MERGLQRTIRSDVTYIHFSLISKYKCLAQKNNVVVCVAILKKEENLVFSQIIMMIK